MAVSYKKLWKLLIDKDMKKKDLCEKAGISPASVTKMGRNGHVTTEILLKICTAPRRSCMRRSSTIRRFSSPACRLRTRAVPRLIVALRISWRL